MSLANSVLEIILHITEKRNSLVSDRISKLLIKHYGGNAGHNFSLNEVGGLGYGLIHYSLITNLKPKRILCIGSEKGYIPTTRATTNNLNIRNDTLEMR